MKIIKLKQDYLKSIAGILLILVLMFLTMVIEKY
ncbi:hypothetical protein C8D70_1295 [Chryseobacterium sp. CBTAP 102]|nr:hypothetical protein C8D70_1295 [Chryseobacterium sp. CBTAP 102]